jgi:hypothetical protein
MQVRDVLAERHQATTVAVHKIVEQFDHAEITGQEMSDRLNKVLREIINNAFDFGFTIGVTVGPDDLEDGETALDIRLEEIDPEETDAP